MSIFILQSYSRVLLFFSRPFAPLSRMLSLLLGAIVTYAIAIFSTISICMLKFSLLSHYMLCLLLSVMVLLAKRRHHFFCSSLEHRAMQTTQKYIPSYQEQIEIERAREWLRDGVTRAIGKKITSSFEIHWNKSNFKNSNKKHFDGKESMQKSRRHQKHLCLGNKNFGTEHI